MSKPLSLFCFVLHIEKVYNTDDNSYHNCCYYDSNNGWNIQWLLEALLTPAKMTQKLISCHIFKLIEHETNALTIGRDIQWYQPMAKITKWQVKHVHFLCHVISSWQGTNTRQNENTPLCNRCYMNKANYKRWKRKETLVLIYIK